LKCLSISCLIWQKQSRALVVRCIHRPCSWYHKIPRDADLGLTALQMQYNFLFVSYPCQEGWGQPEGMSATRNAKPMLPEVGQSCAGALTFLLTARWKHSEVCSTTRQPQLVEGAASQASACLLRGYRNLTKFSIAGSASLFFFSTVFRPALGLT
jgi:hypothetical protein